MNQLTAMKEAESLRPMDLDSCLQRIYSWQKDRSCKLSDRQIQEDLAVISGSKDRTRVNG